jgi:hypothetical protein
MKRYLTLALLTVNLALVAVLLALWVDSGGRLRNSAWQRPAAIKPDFASLLAPLATQGSDNVGQFVATLDRPLFSPSRRPPPPPAPVVAPPPDPLANIQLFGVYSGPDGGGIIARVEGKMRRAAINDKIGEWTISRIADRDVTFVRGGEARVVSLVRGRPSGSKTAPAAPPAPAPPVSQIIPGQPRPGRASEEERMRTMTPAQRIEEDERERLRYLNELNAQNGLPPITHR